LSIRTTCHELSPARWADLQILFGDKGACAGCWCMYWRVPTHEFRAIQGEAAKKRLRVLVERDQAHGVLAYRGERPVGWCSFERRVDLPRLDGAPSLKIPDAAEVWSLPCFFVLPAARGQGVARALLAAAEQVLRRRGARVLEAYPQKPPAGKARLPGAFAWTGVPALFESAGWTLAGARERGKQRYRKELARSR
jgi:GNAT superfamily N-acetyltransferase